MVNVTYDACTYAPLASQYPDSDQDLFTAGSIQIHQPEDGPVSGIYNPGDIAWILASTALVWLMIPGVGFFYSGLLRRKNALSMIYLSMMCLAVVSFQVSCMFWI